MLGPALRQRDTPRCNSASSLDRRDGHMERVPADGEMAEESLRPDASRGVSGHLAEPRAAHPRRATERVGGRCNSRVWRA